MSSRMPAGMKGAPCLAEWGPKEISDIWVQFHQMRQSWGSWWRVFGLTSSPSANTHNAAHHPPRYAGTTVRSAGTASYLPHTILKIPSVPEGEREGRQCPGVCHHLPCVQGTAHQHQADALGSAILLRFFMAPACVCSRDTVCSLRGTSAFQLPLWSQSIHSSLQNAVDEEWSAHKLVLFMI